MNEETIVILLIMGALICLMLSFMRAVKITFKNEEENNGTSKRN